jgi:transcriptional regulator with XRE-family HTH domain
MTIADDLDQAMRDYCWPDGRMGISQPELAGLSKVPQPTISRTLKGKSIPETKTLTKLANTLKRSLGGINGTPTSSYRSPTSIGEATVAPYIHPNTYIAKIVFLLERTEEIGIGEVLSAAKRAAKDHPKRAKQTAA